MQNNMMRSYYFTTTTSLLRAVFNGQHVKDYNARSRLTVAFQNRHIAILPSQQHPLLPLPPPTVAFDANSVTNTDATAITSPSAVQEAFLQSHITKVAFIRHGNTAPSPTGVDYDRSLTELGRQQSRIAGSSYGVRELFPYYEKGALCSSAPRCVETAHIFLDASFKTLKDSNKEDRNISMPPLNLQSNMYDGTMQPEGSRLFRSIGYAPLRSYLENTNEDDANAARCVLGGYARLSLDIIWEMVLKHDLDNDKKALLRKHKEGIGTTLLIFSHAIYLPSVALGCAMAIGCREVDLLLHTNTKEAEGYIVHVDTQSVSLLNRPKE